MDLSKVVIDTAVMASETDVAVPDTGVLEVARTLGDAGGASSLPKMAV